MARHVALMRRWRRRLLVVDLLVACCAAAGVLRMPANAEPGYPKRPVVIVMPYGPGGLADVILRIYAQKIEPRLGQQFVIEYRPGGGGAIAAQAVLGQSADGYTVLFTGSGMAISMSLSENRPFDIVRDFTHISIVAVIDELLFAIGVNSPLRSVQDIVAEARKNPGKLTIGTINSGSTQNLTAYLFQQAAGIEATVVPYKTSPELTAALMRGDVDVGIDYYAAFQPIPDDTRFKIVATTGEKRSPLLPDVPTVRESGYPGFVVTSWSGLSAPKGIPEDALEVLNRAIVAAASVPDVRQGLMKFGMTATGSTSQEMTAAMAREVEKWSEVIKKAGLQLH